jgi:dTDP-4-dehydrorhamnose reductase
MKKILIIGANGQLGSCLRESIEKNVMNEFEVTYASFPNFDLTDSATVVAHFTENKYEYIINSAAYTAVDKAEEEVSKAYQLNAEAVDLLAKEAKKQEAIFIHVSTDYVFDGTGSIPYKEEDVTNPINIYGKSKLQGEINAIRNNEKTFVIRTSWLYSAYRQNFVKSMIRLMKERTELGIVDDQKGSPTSAHDLAEMILYIIKSSSEDYGVYHFSNEGIISWCDFAKAIAVGKNLATTINPIKTEAYPTPAKRPMYSVMDKSKIKKTFNKEVRDWKVALNEVLVRL